MMKLSEKDGAKDVNEPMKSRVTAVTAVALAIKHGALAALEYTWGACSCACSTHGHTWLCMSIHFCSSGGWTEG